MGLARVGQPPLIVECGVIRDDLQGFVDPVWLRRDHTRRSRQALRCGEWVHRRGERHNLLVQSRDEVSNLSVDGSRDPFLGSRRKLAPKLDDDLSGNISGERPHRMLWCRFAIDPLTPPRHSWGPRVAHSAGPRFRHRSRDENSYSQQHCCLPQLHAKRPLERSMLTRSEMNHDSPRRRDGRTISPQVATWRQPKRPMSLGPAGTQ